MLQPIPFGAVVSAYAYSTATHRKCAHQHDCGSLLPNREDTDGVHHHYDSSLLLITMTHHYDCARIRMGCRRPCYGRDSGIPIRILELTKCRWDSVSYFSCSGVGANIGGGLSCSTLAFATPQLAAKSSFIAAVTQKWSAARDPNVPLEEKKRRRRRRRRMQC